MPAFSFKERFVTWVKDGSKPGTIRSFRKYPIKAGQPAHLYYGMRTRHCTKIVDPSPMIREVKCILIRADGRCVIFETGWIAPIDRERVLQGAVDIAPHWELNIDELDSLAWKDGFRHQDAPEQKEGCRELMFAWWKEVNGLPFLGNHIIWGE